MKEVRKKRLRVLVATPLGRGGRGGIDRVMDNLAAALAVEDDGVSVQVVSTRGSGHPIMMVPLMARFMIQLFAGWTFRRIDLVHINVAQRGSIKRKALIARVCYSLGIPYTLHVHGSQFHHSWNGDELCNHKHILRLVGDAARIIVLGTFWRDFVVSIGADPSRVVIIPNATPHPKMANVHRMDRPARILFLGQLGARKGVPQLVEALGNLVETPAWRATLAGDGDIEETRKHVARRDLTSRVAVAGWAEPEDVVRMLETHDILVLPSFNENLPMAVIEGMAYGMAIVATPVGAVEDIVEHDVSGILVAPGDVPALTEALRRCVADAVLRQRLGSRARAFHANHLDLAGYASRVKAVWRSALPGGSRR